MADLHVRLAGRELETPIIASAALLVFAFASKSALFPVFFWLPAAYHTPSFAASAVFAALLTKVGVYALIRIFTLVYDIDGTPVQTLLLWGAVATMVTGALGALAQPTIRRVLGFGVVSSVGYMVLGLAIGTPLALVGGVFYLLQDVLTKTGLFLGAGAARRLSGSEDLSRTGGLWRAHPWTSALFLLPALSLAGMPPFSGFWAKLLLAQATVESRDWWLTFAVLAVGLLTLFAMARVWAEVFWDAHPAGDQAAEGRAPLAMILPLAVVAGLITLVGVYAAPFVDAAGVAAATLLEPASYVAAVRGGAP
jgi:multicomponent Na+:H+ antiporter subunit D